MMMRRAGAIVFLSSILARVNTIAPGQAAYVTSKMAVTGLHDALFAELRGTNIKGARALPTPSYYYHHHFHYHLHHHHHYYYYYYYYYCCCYYYYYYY